jgi:predicted nucleic acid-binding protein
MIALDTNVLIYACDRADSKRQQIAIDLIANSRDGVLLWQVACEFVAASRKLNAQGFTALDAWSRLAGGNRGGERLPDTVSHHRVHRFVTVNWFHANGCATR